MTSISDAAGASSPCSNNRPARCNRAATKSGEPLRALSNTAIAPARSPFASSNCACATGTAGEFASIFAARSSSAPAAANSALAVRTFASPIRGSAASGFRNAAWLNDSRASSASMAQSRLLMRSRPLPRLTPDSVLPRSYCSSACWVWSATGAGGRRRSPPEIVSHSRAIAASQVAIPESSLEPASGGDEAVDLAIAEQPSSVLLCHLVGVGAARPDLWPFGAVLHHGPVRAHLGALAVWSTGQRDGDIGHQMHRARPVVAGLGTDVARQTRDRGAAGRLAKGGVPGTVLRKQRRHVVIAAAIEPKAILGHGLADGVLFLDRGRHGRILPRW